MMIILVGAEDGGNMYLWNNTYVQIHSVATYIANSSAQPVNYKQKFSFTFLTP